MRYADRLDETALRRYASALNGRARMAAVPGEIDADQLRGVILDSGGRCNWCGATVLDSPFEIDHVLSVARGGPNRPDNLALACPDCNRQKSYKHPARFAAEVLARGAARTAFLDRVIAQYGGDDPGAQLGLFDVPAPPPAPLAGLDAPSDDEDDAPPPYVW